MEDSRVNTYARNEDEKKKEREWKTFAKRRKRKDTIKI